MRTKFIAPVLFLATTIFSCTKEKLPVNIEPTVKKEVEFKVYAAEDFSDPVYDNVTAEVKLSIHSVDVKTGKSSTLWDTTFASRSIKAYPNTNAAIQIQKELVNVNDSKTKITVASSTSYNYKGYLSSEAKFETMENGNSRKLMEVVFAD